jgi:hypothetical protein
MLIHLNGFPGVGKLTIGKLLCDRLQGRLLDNHSVYNVAFALTEFKSPEFYDAVRAVQTIAYERAAQLPREIPLILTNAHFEDSTWGNECWDAAIDLARRRGSALYVVILSCNDLDEHDRRIRSPDRALKRKPQDPAIYTGRQSGRRPIDRGGDHLLHLDVTALRAEDSADRIVQWIAAS